MIHIAKKIVDAVYKVKWLSLMGVSGIEAKSIQPTTPYIKIYYHFCWVYLSVRSESTYFMLRSQGIDILKQKTDLTIPVQIFFVPEVVAKKHIKIGLKVPFLVVKTSISLTP